MAQQAISDLLSQTERGDARRQLIKGWKVDVWRRDLAEVDATFDVPAVLDRLAERDRHDGGLTREAVVTAARDDDVLLMVAGMAWGFGDRGYGAARTAQMLSQPATVLRAHLHDMRVAACSGSPRAAFASLFERARTRVPHLGIAMGTKHLYFASSGAPAGQQRPLVYDINVYKGLCSLTDGPASPPDPRRYTRAADYERVVDWIHRVAADHEVMPDDVELALFEHGQQR